MYSPGLSRVAQIARNQCRAAIRETITTQSVQLFVASPPRLQATEATHSDAGWDLSQPTGLCRLDRVAERHEASPSVSDVDWTCERPLSPDGQAEPDLRQDTHVWTSSRRIREFTFSVAMQHGLDQCLAVETPEESRRLSGGVAGEFEGDRWDAECYSGVRAQ
jgi:hypothetical protein